MLDDGHTLFVCGGLSCLSKFNLAGTRNFLNFGHVCSVRGQTVTEFVQDLDCESDRHEAYRCRGCTPRVA